MLWQRNSVIEETKFEDLIDDCCREILRRLPLDDLCALSRTCMRLYNLCSEQFPLQYKSKVVYIDVRDGELIMTPSNEEYVKCFAKHIQNVVLSDRVVASKLDAVQAFYSQSNSSEGAQTAVNIKQISFEDCTLTKAGGKAIADMLKTVETIRLCNFETADDLHDCILKHAPNLKCLKLQWNYSGIEYEFADQKGWLKKTYPSLETLEWYAYDPYMEPNVKLIKHFLHLNPNITKFSLFTNRVETINNFLANGVNIDELYFNMAGDCVLERPKVKLSKRILALKSLCDKQNTKLHLLFKEGKSGHLDKMSSIKPKIEGFYFYEGVQMNGLSRFENLRSLMLRGNPNHVKMFADCPNLEEIYIEYEFCNECFDAFYDTILSFLGRSAKLTKLYFKNNIVAFTKFNFDKLNDVRMKLENAAKLKIYVRSKENERTGKLDDIKRIFNSFEIIRAETEMQDDVFFTFLHGVGEIHMESSDGLHEFGHQMNRLIDAMPYGHLYRMQ